MPGILSELLASVSDPVMASLHTVLAGPLAALLGAVSLSTVIRRHMDKHLGRVLDRVMSRKCQSLPLEAGESLLAFRTSERLGWLDLYRAGFWLPWRVKVVRTVAGAFEHGYRVRLWAITCGFQGRLLERVAVVELRRSR